MHDHRRFQHRGLFVFTQLIHGTRGIALGSRFGLGRTDSLAKRIQKYTHWLFETETALLRLRIKIQLEAESLLLGAEYEIESEKVLALARDSTCSAYDCEFVALAMKLNSKLVTMDRALLRAFPNCTQPLPTS